MIQQADQSTVRSDAPDPSAVPAAHDFHPLVFDPDFRKAIRESLVTAAPVKITIRPDELRFPGTDEPGANFCEQALSGCPLNMNLSLLNGRSLRLALLWVVDDQSIAVTVRATDVTEQMRNEEMEALRQSQRDIDRMIEQSEAARRIRESEERYRATFEQAAVGILHTSLEGRILRCNRRFGDMIGFAPEEVAGLSFQAITPPGDRPPGKAVLERMVSGDLPTGNFEKRYVRKDGTLTWVNLTITVQRDTEGRPVHFITMVQDINARKDAEAQLALAQESLRTSEERYRTAFQMTMDVVALNRVEDGTYLDCNLAFQNLTGYSREEILGRTSAEIAIWADIRDRNKVIERVRQTGECRNYEAQFRKKNGEVFWGMMSATVIEINHEPCLLTVTHDLSEAKTAENEIKRLAFYDPLTGLPNRRMLLERLRQALAFDRRDSRKRALLFVDVDNFKNLNDTLGHHIGDLLLQEIAHRITSCIRESDMAARIGGDEFVVMLENLSDAQEEAGSQASIVAEKLLSRIAEPCTLAQRECISTSSVGITVFGNGKESAAQILQQADIAMYQAKAAGRNTIRFFAPSLQAAVSARACLEDEIRQGLRSHQFCLWYQPQVDSGQVIGAEALVRWNHPRRGLLGPIEFIPIAEETGLIVPLGRMVIEEACRQGAAWAGLPGSTPIPIAVNVSARASSGSPISSATSLTPSSAPAPIPPI